MKFLYYLLPLLAITAVSCTNNKGNTDNAAGEEKSTSVAVSQIVEIDLQKDYPEKILLLDEIADIEYIPLETSDSVLLGSSLDRAFSGDMVVLADKNQGTVFFFNRQGKFLRSFNHKGQGDREYTDLIAMCADFAKEEIFIYDHPLRYRILVYSFDGEFKRELKLEGPKRWVSRLYAYDETHLVSYDMYDPNYKDPSGEKFNRYPYFLIDKQSGEISSLPLKVDKRIPNQVSWKSEDSIRTVGIRAYNWMKVDKGIYVSDFALDTIYHCTGDKITPKAVRKNNPDKKMNFCSLSFESNRYLFFYLNKVHIYDVNKRMVPEIDSKEFVFDKREGKVYDTFIALKDFSGWIKLPGFNSVEALTCIPIFRRAKDDIPEGYYIDFFSVDMLNSFLEEGALRGKIKEIAENMEEDANPVMFIAKFKE